GSKEPVALLGRQTFARVRQFEHGRLAVHPRAERKPSAIRHSVNGVEHQVLHDAAQQYRIPMNRRKLVQLKIGLDFSWLALELSLKKLDDAADQFIEIH